MTKCASSSAATAAKIVTKAPTPRHLSLMMEFNIIVTFNQSRETAVALSTVTDDNTLLYGWQITFNYRTSVSASSSYDSLMRRLRKAALDEAKAICGLGEENVAKISTAGNWKLWEQITGLCEADEATRSKVAKDGKFYF